MLTWIQKSLRGTWRKVVLGLVVLVLGWAALEYWTLPDVRPLLTENPATTALIEVRAEESLERGEKPRRRQTWLPLEAVSRHAVAAVVLAEDASFYLHDGIDTVELRRAVEQAIEKGSLGRGASTITQQLAKNLYLSNQRSLLRKAKEVVLARRLDDVLTKRRILTLYLNVVEWGDGVYGIEAASQEHFGVHARELSVAQGAMLAGMLPNPRKRLPRQRPRSLYRYARKIIGRMQAAHRVSPEEAARAQRELSNYFGLSKPEPKGGLKSDGQLDAAKLEPDALSDEGDSGEGD